MFQLCLLIFSLMELETWNQIGERSFSNTTTFGCSRALLFFAVYVIYKKNYSFSRVVFFQSKTANSFYSKINDSSRVRTTAFSSSRFGVRVSVVPNVFAIYPQHFLIPEISETLKGSLTEFFGTVRQKIFDGKLWYPYYALKNFDTPNFLKHWRDAHEIFRHCETKIPPPPPLMHKIFRYPKFSDTPKCSTTKFSVLWDQKFWTKSRDTPSPLLHKI